MTLADLRNEVWKGLGESSDLDPSSDVQLSGSSWVDVFINEGQRAIAFWKQKSNGKRLRIPSLLSSLNFHATVIEGTLGVDGTTLLVTLPAADIGSEADRYNDWILEINGEKRIVVDSATYVLTLAEAFTTAPATGDTYKLSKNFYYLLPSTHAWVSDHISLPVVNDVYRAEGNLLKVIGVYDISDRSSLEYVGDKESYFTDELGTPSSFALYANKIIFDVGNDESRWYKVEYYRTPKNMILSTDIPEIPEIYHYAIVLYALSTGFARLQDFQASYKFSSDFDDFLRSRLSMDEMVSERQKDIFKITLR